jgi:hypothetical protein
MSVLFQGAFLIRFKGKADKAALGILFNYLIVNGFRIFLPKMLYSTWDRIQACSNLILFQVCLRDYTKMACSPLRNVHVDFTPGNCETIMQEKIQD